MNRTLIAILILASIFLLFQATEVARASEYLSCQNFTGDKYHDCQYVSQQDLDEGEEQEVLHILWDQSYEFDSWHPEDLEELIVDLSMDIDEIDNGTFILASKIFIFGLFNYALFSFLTKPALMRKWRVA